MGKAFWRGLKRAAARGPPGPGGRRRTGAHVEMAVAEKVARGMDEAPPGGRRGIELGIPRKPGSASARAGRARSWTRCARTPPTRLRMLRKRPGFSALCGLTIALGVGASTTLFAVLGAVVLNPLPYPGADSLVRIFDTNLEAGIERTGATTGNLVDWRRRARFFDGIAGYYSMGRTLTGDAGSEVVLSAQVTEDFFPVLGRRRGGGTDLHDGGSGAGQLQHGGGTHGRGSRGGDRARALAAALWRRSAGRGPLDHRRATQLPRGGRDAERLRPAGAGRPDVAALGHLRQPAPRPALPGRGRPVGGGCDPRPGRRRPERGRPRRWPRSTRRPTAAGVCVS